MKRSRTSLRFFAPFGLVLGLGLLSACGPRSGYNSPAAPSGSPSELTSSETKADVDGPTSQDSSSSYITLSPPGEVQQMNAAVASTEKNKEFAKAFESAAVSMDEKNSVQVVVNPDSPNPLVFQGTLKKGDTNFEGEIEQSSGNQKLKLDVSCKDGDCSDADLLLKNQEGDQAGIIVRTTTREEQVKKADVENFEPLSEVIVTSSEVVPTGVTSYVVKSKTQDPKKSQVLFKGKAKTSDDGVVPVDSIANEEAGVSTALVGADPDELVFQSSKKKDPQGEDEDVVFYKTVPKKPSLTKPTLVPADNAPKCPVHIEGNINKWTNLVLRDCSHPRVVTQMNKWKNRPESDLAQFLGIYEESKTDSDDKQASDFRTMVNILQNNNFPVTWSLVPYGENTLFEARTVSKGNDAGVWQISPDTALRTCHISLADRKRIEPATNCAVTLYKDIMGPNNWGDNVKMVLASYNAGLGGTKDIPRRNHIFTEDFWELCRLTTNGKLRKNTCIYVAKIEAAMITSLDPAALGMTKTRAMEAL